VSAGRRMALALASALALAGAALAADDWKAEFEAVCAKTQDAMVLSTEELKELVARCDRLKPSIDALEPSPRKVYGKRLQACRELYQFVLDTRAAPR
jgi:hypothetical protein